MSETSARTHPWITFSLDLRRAGMELWLLLGEAQSKCEHLAGVPLMPSVAEKLHQIYLIKGVVATTAIEGNTLSEADVKARIDGTLRLPPSKAYLGQDVDNILEACKQIARKLLVGGPVDPLTVDDLRRMNALVLRDLPVDEGVVPGEIRRHPVGVGRYLAPLPEACEPLLGRLCEWLNTGFVAPTGQEIVFGILKAIIAHLYLAWIHPFGDGNGRTARLLELEILLSARVPTAAAHLLSNHYNQTRSEYYRQLDAASRSGGDVMLFLLYALRGLVDGLKEQLAEVQRQQMAVHWRDFVSAQFHDGDTAPQLRQRRLVLDLSDATDPVPLNQLRYLSPWLAEAYADKTLKTLRRDVNHLKSMGLIEETAAGLRARQDRMLAFRPERRPE